MKLLVHNNWGPEAWFHFQHSDARCQVVSERSFSLIRKENKLRKCEEIPSASFLPLSQSIDLSPPHKLSPVAKRVSEAAVFPSLVSGHLRSPAELNIIA